MQDQDRSKKTRWGPGASQAILASKLPHPVQVAIIEAFSYIGLTLCVRDLAEIIGDIEVGHLEYHVGRLRKIGMLEPADSRYATKGALEMPYRLTDDRNPLAVRLAGTLRKHRLRLGVSQEELARRTSLHRTEISMLERGQREPRLGTIVMLAGALEVSLGSLFAGIQWNVKEKSFVIGDQDDA